MRLELCGTQSLLFAVKLKLPRDKILKEQFRFVFVGFMHCRRNRGNSRMLISVDFRAGVFMVVLVVQYKSPDALR